MSPRRHALALLLIGLPAPASCLSDDLPPEHFRAIDLYGKADFKGALPLFEVLRASFQARGDDERAGVEAQFVGMTERILGAHEKAVAAENDAIEHLRRTGDKTFEADAHREAFLALRALKRDEDAGMHAREMLRLDEESENDAALDGDLRAVGDFLVARGDAAGALSLIDRRVARHTKTGGKFLEGDARIARGAVLRSLGRIDEAVQEDSLGRKLQTEARNLARARHADAELDQQKALAEQKASVYDRAGSYAAWQTMLAMSKKKDFKNGVTIALMNIGTYDDNSGQHQKAAAEFEEGARVAKEDDEGLNETNLVMLQGVATANSGDINGGLALLHRARGLAVLRKDTNTELAILQSQRIVYGLRGDYARMLACNDQILAVARRDGRKKSQLEAESMIGQFFENIGDGEAAAAHYEQELALARDLGDRTKIAEALNDLAGGVAVAGDFTRAETLYRESLAIHDWTGGRVNLGDTYLSLNEPEKALPLLRPVTEWHIDLGKYYLLKNDYARARELYAHNVASTEKDRDVYYAIAAHTGLGLAYEGLSDYARAAEEYTRSENLIDGLRESLSPAHRVHFMGTSDWQMPHIEPFEGMVRASEFLPGGLREALHHAEFTRGRLFAEAAARRYGAALTEIPTDKAAREAALNETVSLLANGAETALRASRMDEYRSVGARLEKARLDRDAFVAELRKDFPEYAAVRYPLPLYADEILLDPGEVLIEFEVTEPYTKGFVVKDGRVAFSWNVALTRGQLTELVKKYRGYFEGVADARQLAAYDPRLGLKLFRLLLRPALEAKDDAGRALIASDAKLTIIPDEILGILPFESLVVSAPVRAQMPIGRHGPAPVGVHYAGDLYDIAYEHSATAMTVTRRLERKTSPASGLFVLADPIFNPADPRQRGSAAAQPPESAVEVNAVGVTMGLGGARGGLAARKQVGREDFLFPRLDKTGTLATDLRDKVFAGGDAQLLVGVDANKAELSRRDLSRYRYLVFATHGLLDNMVPGLKEPALVLNQLGPGVGSGFLTMSEIMELRLGADVVALTACETGLGRQLTGEGVMGLGRAFQHAGARSVLVSLWSVAEDSTTLLAERFFVHLKEGKSKRLSLRLARADVRHAGYEHPFYWAPFILIGG